MINFKVIKIEELIPFLNKESKKELGKEINPSLVTDYKDLVDANNLHNVSTLPNRVLIGFYFNNELIGYAALMDSAPAMHLDLIYIQEEYRNKKIGKAFLDVFPIQSIYTNPHNERAIDLYLSSGFKVKQIVPDSKTSVHFTRVRKYKPIEDKEYGWSD